MRKPFITAKIKKLFHGFSSVRSYKVDEAKARQLPLVIFYKDDTMTIYPKDLDKGIPNGYKIKSKQKEGQVYDLIDYDWKADPKIMQETLL